MTQVAQMSCDFRSRVLSAIESVLPRTDLPRLLWWMGTRKPTALWRQEQLGLELADAISDLAPGTIAPRDLEAALARWTEALRVAKSKQKELGGVLGPRPIWAFWSCYTRPDEEASPLSVLLREEVGYPTDAEAGIAVPVREWGDLL